MTRSPPSRRASGLRTARARDRHRVPARVPAGVLQHVHERALHLHRVDPHERQVTVDREAESSGAGASSPSAARISSSTEVQSRRGSAAPASRRERSSRLSTSRESRRVSSWMTAAISSRSCSRQRRRADRLAGGRDRRQWRAQVVGDRPQQRRLDHVRTTQRRRLDDAAEQRVALERRAQQRLERRHDPLLQPAQARLGGVRADEQRPEPARALAQRERDAALVPLDRLHLDRRRGQLERLRQTRRGRRQILREALAAQQQPRHLGGEIGLAPALLGLARARARDLRDRAGQRGDHEERDQRHPVAGVPGSSSARPAAGGRS